MEAHPLDLTSGWSYSICRCGPRLRKDSDWGSVYIGHKMMPGPNRAVRFIPNEIKIKTKIPQIKYKLTVSSSQVMYANSLHCASYSAVVDDAYQLDPCLLF